MRLNHPDYIKLVIHAYKKKRANNELSPLLAQSTPGNIRRECANVYQERYEKKDEPALRAFFGPGEHGKKFLAAIQDFHINRFKSLDKFLKGDGVKGINDRNLNLLAWLIDFDYRPYTYGMEITLNNEERIIIEGSVNAVQENKNEFKELNKVKEGNKEIGAGTMQANGTLPKDGEEELVFNNAKPEIFPIVNPVNNSQKGILKKAIIIILMLIICAGGIYAVWQQTKNATHVCVRWVGDHYEEVPCNADPKDGVILSMKPEKMKSFRKITRQDTITEWSIGKLYYIKNNNKIECYTEGGNYPEDLKRPLRVLTSRMFEKYLVRKDTNSVDSSDE